MKVLLNDKVWDQQAIQDLIDRSDEAVARALMIVYENQTADEKACFATKHDNGVGFTGADAEWLTDIAKKWLIWRRWASARQCNAVRKSVRKYHRQILQHMLDTKPGARLVNAREARVLSASERFAQGIAA
jgi:hypothetical protein